MRAAALRATVVTLARTLAARGYLAGTGGNIALQVDAESFAVTPSATDYYAMEARDVPLLRLSDLERIEGARAPSVESSLHAEVFRRRPECVWSIHTHQPVASACALLGEPLRIAAGEPRALLGAQVELVGYAPSGTRWLTVKLARALTPASNAYFLQNHGILCCGERLESAVDTVAALEDVCAAHVRTRILARAAHETPSSAPLRALAVILDARSPALKSRSLA